MKYLDILEKPIYERPLKKGHSLAILQNEEADVVQVRNAQGITLFTIEVSEQGTNLIVSAENIQVNAKKNLSFTAENVSIKSRNETTMECGGNLVHKIMGNATTNIDGDNVQEAKAHLIKANLGDVKIKANDDVKLNGERVKLNCDE